MVKRTTKHILNFRFDFSIRGIKEKFRAGEYTVEAEEVSILGIAFLPFRRRRTTLIRRPPSSALGHPEYWRISKRSLNMAKIRDTEQCRKAERSAITRLQQGMTLDDLRSEHLSIIDEPIPERLAALVERLRKQEE